MAGRVTIYSLAGELGLHPSTVSRAFNRPELVRADVRERVLRRAEEVDYRPNRAARSLVTGRTQMIGLLTPDVEHPFFPPLIRAVQKAAAERDLGILLLDAELQADREAALLGRIRHQVDGLLIASPVSTAAQLTRAVGDTPAVLLNRGSDTFASVAIDHAAALAEAGDLLTGLGHRRIAALHGPARSWAARQRTQAVRRWAQAGGVDLCELGPFPASYAGGLAAAEQLAGSGATAAFAFDDLMACGVVAGLATHGVRVPAGFSLIGCDDVLLSRVLTPPLTTLAASLSDLATAAFDLLGGSPSRSVRIASRLMVRGTTGPPPDLAAGTPTGLLTEPAHHH